MINTKKRVNYIIMISIIVIAMLVGMLAPLQKVYAAEVALGSVNYEGSNNYCRYNIKFYSDTIIDGNKFDKNSLGIALEGVACKRNIFTTFSYSIKFRILKESSPASGIYDILFLETAILKFKVTDKDQVTTGDYKFYVLFLRHNFTAATNYKLDWEGSIVSNSTVEFKADTSYIYFSTI